MDLYLPRLASIELFPAAKLILQPVILKDFESIDFSVSDKQKFECSKFLSQSLISVKSNINNLNKFTLYDNNLKDKIELIKSIIENYDKIIAEMFDDKNNIQVISHNDIHLANILLQENLNIDSFKLIDYEFTCYNYFGFDIANYIVESFFDLYYEEYPYFKVIKNYDEIFDESYYKIYSEYIEFIYESKCSFVEKTNKEFFLNKIYFYKLIGLSSLFWFLFANVQLKFETWKEKKTFDYLYYMLDRLQFYLIIQDKIKIYSK